MTATSSAVLPPAAVAPPAAEGVIRRVALIGNPNTGKTTLFNALCGARAKTSNFPGTTTSVRTGAGRDRRARRRRRSTCPASTTSILDSPETAIAANVLAGAAGPAPDAVIVIVDACNLSRNLVLVGQLIARGIRLVVALNMVDLAARRGLSLNVETLTRRLGVPVVPTVARSGQGLDLLRRAPRRPAAAGARATCRRSARSAEALADWAAGVAVDVASGHDQALAHDRRTERLDAVLTHPVSGLLAFVAIMGGAVLDPVRAGDRADGSDRGDLRAARRAGRADAAGGRGARPGRPGHRRRHRRHGGVPAADLPALLPHHAARGHRLPGARGVRDGPATSPASACPATPSCRCSPRTPARCPGS